MGDNFNASVTDLLSICRKVFALKEESSNLSFATKRERRNDKDQNKKLLENYASDFMLSDEQDNKEDIISSFKQYKLAFLNGFKSEELLRSNNIAIYSGADEPDPKHKLPFSYIYNLACILREKSKTRLVGLPVEAYAGCEELLYPAYMQLYMYRVLLFSLPEENYKEEIVKVSHYVTELEKELKISTKLSLVEEKTVDNLGSAVGEGIAGMAKDFASKMGFELPKEMAMPNPTEIMGIASAFFSKPETRELMNDFGSTMSEVKDVSDIGEGIKKMMTKFQEPEVIEKITKVATSFVKPEAEVTHE